MKNIRDNILNWIRFGGFVLIWVAVLYLSKQGLKIDLEALKRLPLAITIYAAVHFVFTTWAWRLPILQAWLVPFPDIQGTWQGVVSSTSRDAGAGDRRAPIPVVLVIKQTFSTLSCLMLTEESESVSSAAQIARDEQNGVLMLSYNYTNRPRATVRDRSAIHDGAAVLRITRKPKTLEGEYWTSRRTTGEIKLQFRTRQLVEAFPDDLRGREDLTREGKP